MLIRITLTVHDSALRKQLQDVLARPDILVQVPRARKDLWERVVRDPSDVLIISQSLLPNPLKDKMRDLQHHPDSPAAVVLSDSADPKERARLIAAGCDVVLFSGLAVEQIRDVIETRLEKRRRLAQKRFFAPQPLAEPRLADFVSQSPGMAVFMNVVPRLVQSDTALLIDGETGVGKERLASAIHAEGRRSTGRFVALNCGALPEHLLESELFGHVRGAFTGATAARRGWFEIAHRGTLFLDEVGEIPVHLQVKLLRVLPEHEIQPIGSEKSFGVDVRVIAASNRPLEPEVEAGRFRRDLYHRLSAVTITIPPLRDRMEDNATTSSDALPPYAPVASLTGKITSIGESTTTNLVARLAAEFRRIYPDVTLEVTASLTSIGPSALQDGRADIVPMSRELNAEEVQGFTRKYG